MRLTPVDSSSVSSLREERRRATALAIMPVFYEHLAEESEAHLFQEVRPGDDVEAVVGYALTLERPHNGHSHVTTIEFHLAPGYQHRYEDALDLLRDELQPTAYLTRTDDCLYNATLLSRGLQVEPTALVMLWRDPKQATGRLAASAIGSSRTGSGAVHSGAASAPPGALTMPELAVLKPEHMQDVRALLDAVKDEEILSELENMAVSGRGWTVSKEGSPVAVIARRDAGDGVHELLDFALARAPEAELSRALLLAAETVAEEGLAAAAVIDAAEAARHRIFRGASFFTSASYLVYYDPGAGRPSVARVTTEELERMLERGEHFRLVDVLGEQHWKEGHIPGSEWIDFKGLAKQARERFELEEPIVLYCNGFT